ncbi:protein of unknown function [Glycomyces sambucus]|uniref:DUF4259 domain-containing protein n=1 Tax=Glycomyces sambucus TaxID=380244 RepID=A0A1G9DKJ0_9ACTN|nr:DUF4259 domain-containing protein [Glycomyces sambucus]SDK64453.1 protein of unknown function [Glycomyces sambucus]
MGAWDYGPFDNDGAWDRIAELGDDAAANTERLEAAMLEVLVVLDYVENPEAQGAVGAAVLTAVRLGAPAPSERITELLAAHPFDADDLRDLARRTLKRVTENPVDNEWHDLWLESGALDKAVGLLAPYKAVLETER